VFLRWTRAGRNSVRSHAKISREVFEKGGRSSHGDGQKAQKDALLVEEEEHEYLGRRSGGW
jgi:hypothetical protein